ncbi:hypothetical protein RBB50_003282 [Rhinocladiella similis]|jgi:hypothetical protein
MPVFEIADVPVRVPEGSDRDEFVHKLQEVPRAIAYYDTPRFSLPSPHLRLRLARRARQDRPRRKKHVYHRSDNDLQARSTAFMTATGSRDSSSSVYSKVRRQRLIRRSHSLYGLPEESEDSENEAESNLEATAESHTISDKRIFVHTGITISESLELDLPAGGSHIPRLITHISGAEAVDTGADANLSRAIPESRPGSIFMESSSWQPNEDTCSRSSSSPSSSQSTSADVRLGVTGRAAAFGGRSKGWSKRWSTASQPSSSSTPTTCCSSRREALTPASGSKDEAVGNVGKQNTQTKRRTRFRLRIPDFLRPLDTPQPPIRTYDLLLRRDLFSKAQPGNETPLTTVRNHSRKAEADWAKESKAARLARSGSCPVLPPFRRGMCSVTTGTGNSMGTVTQSPPPSTSAPPNRDRIA